MFEPVLSPIEKRRKILREQLAAYAHDAWCGWLRYQLANCSKNADGSLTIPESLVARWTRQMNTPYAKLPESERPSDRAQADEILHIIGGGGEWET